MSMIALAAALVVEIYGFSITQFGLIFATAGISILIGSAINRLLVTRLDSMQVIGIGVALYGISGVSLLIMAWLNAAPFVLLWGSMCLFMASVAIVMPNATVIALDPLPKIAGVASSIIGTMQNIIGASGGVSRCRDLQRFGSQFGGDHGYRGRARRSGVLAAPDTVPASSPPPRRAGPGLG